jgi:hypothetical protein
MNPKTESLEVIQGGTAALTLKLNLQCPVIRRTLRGSRVGDLLILIELLSTPAAVEAEVVKTM